jgi:hypothetical protein
MWKISQPSQQDKVIKSDAQFIEEIPASFPWERSLSVSCSTQKEDK